MYSSFFILYFCSSVMFFYILFDNLFYSRIKRYIINFIAQKRGISTEKLLSTIKPNLKRKNNEILTTKTKQNKTWQNKEKQNKTWQKHNKT